MANKLSNNWVSEEYINWKRHILRKFNKENSYKINNILNFYKNSDFKYRPWLLNKGENFIEEEFIEWEVLMNPTYKEIQEIAQNISILNQYESSNENVEEYIRKKSEYYISTMNLESDLKQEINNIIWYILNLANKDSIIKTWYIHKDLKPWNIIKNKNKDLILIDWERVQIGNIVADTQKVLHMFLNYNPKKWNDFLDKIMKSNNENRNNFVILDTFYYIITMTLHLSKWKIDKTFFRKSIDFKINQAIKWKII